MNRVVKIPGILLVVAAVINLFCTPVPTCPGVTAVEFGIAFLIYLTLGVLACVAGFNKKHLCASLSEKASKGVAIATLVVCPLALGMAIAQVRRQDIT
jgi:uncharacterized membrane protein